MGGLYSECLGAIRGFFIGSFMPLNKKERNEADRDHKSRQEMPASAFLEGDERKYPVKAERNGQWEYDRDLLIAAASEARMHGHDDLADRADDIRAREFGQAHDAYALDRASVRTKDVDGRLHVAISNISKACVSPYFGREIPNADALGLDQGRVYQLLRDPDELARAAPTFDHIPLLSEHIPVSVDAPQKEIVVGSTGTDSIFESPYLKNSLVVWDAQAITGVENGDQMELSCAYRYTADMTPGIYEGTPYDGVMRNIQGNHVALVETGRAGPDVVVGDSQINPKGNDMPMSNEEVTIAKGKVIAIAADGHLTASGKAKVTKALTLAMDAKSDPTDLEAALKSALALDEDDKEKEEPSKPAEDEDEQGENESDEDYKKRMAAKAADEDDDEDDDKVDKAAMDAAIKSAVSATRKATIQQMNAIKQAEREVAPFIGEVVAQDSAEAVYKLALDAAGVDTQDVPPAAFRAMVGMLTKPSEAKPHVAMDAAGVSDFQKRFPNAVLPARS